MQDYSIQRSNRRCHKSDRPFEPGERYYSAIIERGTDLVRVDVARDQWNGPPENSVGWWVSQMPDKRPGKLALAPVPVLLDTLEKLCESPDDQELAYMLSLLLVRRRVLTEAELEHDVDDQDDDEVNETHLHLSYASDGREFVVPVRVPAAEQHDAIQQRLTELLYCET